jgi:hypothetical protein
MEFFFWSFRSVISNRTLRMECSLAVRSKKHHRDTIQVKLCKEIVRMNIIRGIIRVKVIRLKTCRRQELGRRTPNDYV